MSTSVNSICTRSAGGAAPRESLRRGSSAVRDDRPLAADARLTVHARNTLPRGTATSQTAQKRRGQSAETEVAVCEGNERPKSETGGLGEVHGERARGEHSLGRIRPGARVPRTADLAHVIRGGHDGGSRAIWPRSSHRCGFRCAAERQGCPGS
jgi:hypothetical protein